MPADDGPTPIPERANLTKRGQRTRSALVRAAREVFERDGFLAARITDIAQTAKVAHGTFYTYFDSKEAAFGAVITELQQELLTGADRSVPPATPSDEDPVSAAIRSIEAANRRYLEGFRRSARIMVVWEQASTHNPEVTRLLHEGKVLFVARAERAIQELQHSGLVSSALDPHLSAYALTGMVSRFAYSWFSQGEDFDFDEVLRHLTLLWANALGLDTSTFIAEPAPS